MQIELPAPVLDFAFRIIVDIGATLELGMFDGEHRRIIPIQGGTVSGPRLNGTVLTGGADWQSVASDGTAHAYARYWLKADDEAVISVENLGIRRGPREVLDRIAAGSAVSPTEYYFRSAPSFTASGAHAWLSKTVFACVGARTLQKVILDVYALA